VQEVVRRGLSDEEQKTAALVTVEVLTSALPSDSEDLASRSIWSQLLTHALAAVGHVEALEMQEPLAAALLTNIGRYLLDRAQFAEARSALERALTISRQTLGLEDSLTMTILGNLGIVLHKQGDLATAREYSRASWNSANAR
jgi:Tfp pilus assembly protein PilF